MMRRQAVSTTQRRPGWRQIGNRGTFDGNIGTGSPIGDAPPGEFVARIDVPLQRPGQQFRFYQVTKQFGIGVSRCLQRCTD
jgi:xanthine dehydrogenase iron-sulfur cluster and FAD-binding subunit A